jgi:hypothetical protein
VQGGVTARAFSILIEARRENGAATRTASAGDGPDHSWRARTEHVLLRPRLGWTIVAIPLLFAIATVAIVIAFLLVLPVHEDLLQ